MTLSLVSHIYNEEYLLPSWIVAHREIFDCAVLIDYGSTDTTRHIFKRFAPASWRLIESRNREFDAVECDAEVMEVEAELPGWKIALNTTEFLICPRVRELVEFLEQLDVTAIRISGFIMVDPSPISGKSISLDQPIWQQFPFGVSEAKAALLRELITEPRPIGRLFHKLSTGGYQVGRHSWSVDQGQLPKSAASILWYGYSPWSEETIRRKTQIGSRVPVWDISAGRGSHHLKTDLEIDAKRLELAQYATNLLERADFSQLTNSATEEFCEQTLEIEINPLPFGRIFSSAELVSYLNGHFGLSCGTLEQIWEEVGRRLR